LRIAGGRPISFTGFKLMWPRQHRFPLGVCFGGPHVRGIGRLADPPGTR
jgi:hypothetical protein